MNANDVAVFLDLDNVVIGATEVNLAFDINLVLEHVTKLTNGRIVLRRAYGDWQQHQTVIKELATAGFELQSIVRLSHMSKNLADMQMVVDAMETLIDGHNFTTYVLITGDRDFVPVVQALRKRGKQVIGMGLKHTSSKSLVNLCDHYTYYEELAPPSQRLLEHDLETLLDQALEELLKEKPRAPASLLKQQLHTLSHGSFTRSKQGRKNFRAVLSRYPHLVEVQQDGTTLYVARPMSEATPVAVTAAAPLPAEPGAVDPLPRTETVEELIQQALQKVPESESRVQASLLKQWLKELSNGTFNEAIQGSRSFRQFLEQYPHLLRIQHEGSTLYVALLETKNRLVKSMQPAAPRHFAENELELLLEQALAELLAEQSRPRASLLKQRLQELSKGAFDETTQGCKNFRQFLEQFPHLVELQQTGSTLFICRPQAHREAVELHLHYRTTLKKKGLRIVPARERLMILQDIITLLQTREMMIWQDVVDALTSYYKDKEDSTVSKSFVGDVMRVAQRARIIQVPDDTPWSAAPVRLALQGERLFQEAVMRCDAVYLQAMEPVRERLDLEEAALALYDTVGRARYLKVVLAHYQSNGRH
jgi:uncharacterized protein (TIGR00288 family)